MSIGDPAPRVPQAVDSLREIEDGTGTYALVMTSNLSREVEVGRLGRLRLQRGAYLYVGSAFGPGGVGARVRRHCRQTDRLHWHVDYLSRRLPVGRVWYTLDGERREHEWAGVLARQPGSDVPLAGFGSSDCGCESHLFLFEAGLDRRTFREAVRRRIPDHGPILRVSTRSRGDEIPG